MTSNSLKIALREADTSYLKWVLSEGSPDKETTIYIQEILNRRERRTFFDGTKHIDM